jgi:peroxiredoxin
MWALSDAGCPQASAWILRHFTLEPADRRDPAVLKLDLYRRVLPSSAREAWLADHELDLLTSLESDIAVIGPQVAAEFAHTLYLGVPTREAARRLRALNLESSALAPPGENRPARVLAACAVWQKVLQDDRNGPLVAACQDALWRLRHLVVGHEVPDFMTADVDGNEIRLSDFRGKVVVVAFFSFSRAEDRAWAAELRSLSHHLEGAPFALLGVNQDSQVALFRRQWEANDLRFECAFEGGSEGRVASAWHLTTPPRCLVIDRDGRLRHVDLQPTALDESIRTLVREPSQSSGSAFQPSPQPPR